MTAKNGSGTRAEIEHPGDSPAEPADPRICDPAKSGDALRNLRHEDERRRGQW